MQRSESRNVLAIGGFIGFVFLAWVSNSFVQHRAGTEIKDTIALYTRIETIHATRALVEFCKTHPVSTIEDDQTLMKLLEQAGVPRGAWFGVAMSQRYNTGERVRRGAVFRLFEPKAEFEIVKFSLLALAGAPPDDSMIDYAHANVILMSDTVAQGDPFRTLQDLMELDGTKGH